MVKAKRAAAASPFENEFQSGGNINNDDELQLDSDEPKSVGPSKKTRKPQHKNQTKEKQAEASDTEEEEVPPKQRLGKNEKIRLKRKEQKNAADKELMLNAREIIPFGERVDAPPKFKGDIGKSISAGSSTAGSKDLLLKALFSPTEKKDETSEDTESDAPTLKMEKQIKSTKTSALKKSTRSTQKKKQTKPTSDDKEEELSQPVSQKKGRKQLVVTPTLTSEDEESQPPKELASKRQAQKQPVAKSNFASENEEEQQPQLDKPASKKTKKKGQKPSVAVTFEEEEEPLPPKEVVLKNKGRKQAATNPIESQAAKKRTLGQAAAALEKDEPQPKKQHKAATVESKSDTSDDEEPDTPPTKLAFTKKIAQKMKAAADNHGGPSPKLERQSARLAARGVKRLPAVAKPAAGKRKK